MNQLEDLLETIRNEIAPVSCDLGKFEVGCAIMVLLQRQLNSEFEAESQSDLTTELDENFMQVPTKIEDLMEQTQLVGAQFGFSDHTISLLQWFVNQFVYQSFDVEIAAMFPSVPPELVLFIDKDVNWPT